MYYIRFLKPPKTHLSNKTTAKLSALISITSDLGERFYPLDAIIKTELFLLPEESESSSSGTELVKQPKPIQLIKLKWIRGMRNIKIDMTFGIANIVATTINSRKLILRVSTESPRPANDLLQMPLGEVLSARSSPFLLPSSFPDGKSKRSDGDASGGAEGISEASRYVERFFRIAPQIGLSIWEETGNTSLARHVWDGGIALASYIAQHINSDDSDGPLRLFHEKLRSNKPLDVIELGSGVGTVGLTFAALRKDCRVILTDLPSAEEIVMRNMQSLVEVSDGNAKTRVSFQVLDWDNPNTFKLATIDLILISDCTYNTDSIGPLVNTIEYLLLKNGSSEDAVIVLAHKVRHDSENMFFDMMRDRKFGMVDEFKFPIIGDSEHMADENQAKVVNLYTFRLLGDGKNT